MAVAELPAQSIPLPRRYAHSSSRSGSAPNLAWVPLVGVLLGLASLFYVAQTGDVAVTGYNIQQMQAEVGDWQMKNEQVALELAKAKGLQRIEAEAKSRLLMVPARDAVYLKTAAAEPGRFSVSARGQSPVTPALEKLVPPAVDPFDPVRSSVSLLIPRAQPAQR